MEKCGVRGCTEKVVGGFQHVIDAGHLGDPSATLLGAKRFWCASHEQSLKQNLGKGRFLSKAQLK